MPTKLTDDEIRVKAAEMAEPNPEWDGMCSDHGQYSKGGWWRRGWRAGVWREWKPYHHRNPLTSLDDAVKFAEACGMYWVVTPKHARVLLGGPDGKHETVSHAKPPARALTLAVIQAKENAGD